jgi:hypothetical protein
MQIPGQRLIRRGDFHFGQHINTFFRVRCRSQPENSVERKLPAGSDKRHLTMFGEAFLRFLNIKTKDLACSFS